MRVHVLTRGTDRDYGFLATPPEDQWWDALSDTGLIITTTAQVAVRGRHGRWSAAAFGIPSERADRLGTPIRYSVLVVDGEPADGDVAVGLVRTVLDPEARAALGSALDKVFTVPLVEGLLADARRESDVPWELLPGILRGAVPEEPPGRSPESPPPTPAPWAGPHEQETVAAFVARTRSLAGGEEEGYATTANGLSSLKGIGTAVAQASSVIGTTDATVLVSEARFDRVTDLSTVIGEAGAKKAEPPAVDPRPPAFRDRPELEQHRWSPAKKLWTAGSAVCVLVLVSLLFLLIM